MLHIIFFIFKVIGIILAALLAILIVLLLLVLFVPIRYRICAKVTLFEKEPVLISVKISWLLHIISVVIAYPSEAYLKVKVFLITIFNSSKAKDKKIRKAAKKAGKETVPSAQDSKDTFVPEQVKTDGHTEIRTDKRTEAELKYIEETAAEKEKKNKFENFIDKIKTIILKILKGIQNFEYTIKEICDKIKRIMEDIDYYSEVFQSETFKSALEISKKQIFRILKNIKPFRFKADFVLGTGDPAGAGQIMAVYGMLYPFVGNNVLIQADFENKIVSGNLFIKGRVTIATILFAGLRIYMDKNIRGLIKMFKREDN